MGTGNFEELTPDMVIDAVEAALGERMSSLSAALPSYINRVYELQTALGERVIGKFYRPERWSLNALEEEHDFVLDCAIEDIPVIAPLPLPSMNRSDGSIDTLGEVNGIFFAVYPKRSGRELNLDDDESWIRLGATAARIHLAGDERRAPNRIRMHPATATANDADELLKGEYISPNHINAFKEITNEIINLSASLFDDAEFTRVHGDCHRGNILERPGEGILVIDFDDMMTAPPVQDLWLLLPGHAAQCRKELDLLIEGYERFRDFDETSLRLIEPLRAMRMIYFLAWCARQSRDFKFKIDFPDWGTNSFWKTEINDLRNQLAVIENSNTAISARNTTIAMKRVLTDH